MLSTDPEHISAYNALMSNAELPSPPREQDMRRFVRSMRLFRWLASPVCFGLDAVPRAGPTLFIGNHTMFGILDTTLMLAEIYERCGIALRALGDSVHFGIPLWGRALLRHGVVEASRENCAALFRAGEQVLVFPGGAREVAKRRGEQYKLVWNERVGFARMAIAHQVPIQPFSAIGVDDAFDILLDADDIMATPIGRFVRRFGLRRDMIMPVVKGLGPTPLPRPERLYYRFGELIDTTAFGSDGRDDEAVFALRDRVRQAIEEGIDWLQAYRADDPGRSLGGRLAP